MKFLNLPEANFPAELLVSIRATRIIAVTVIDNPADAVPLAECLLDAGINSIELTLRTEGAMGCLSAIKENCPGMIVGLGTVLCAEQVKEGKARGAAFAVAPGLNTAVVQAAHTVGLPFAPGITTASEIETAIHLGCRLLKFFPAEPIGGLDYLKSMTGPYAHLGLEFIPLGGLNLNNFTDYLACDNIPAVGGSWIAPRKLIQNKDWPAIHANARAAVAACK